MTKEKTDLDRIFILRPCYENSEHDITEMRSLDMEITELTEEEIPTIREFDDFCEVLGKSNPSDIEMSLFFKIGEKLTDLLKKLERLK